MRKATKMKTTTNKVVQYKQQGNVTFHLFVKSQNLGLQLDLKEMITYPFTAVPYSIATTDRYLAKTDKASLPASDKRLYQKLCLMAMHISTAFKTYQVFSVRSVPKYLTSWERLEMWSCTDQYLPESVKSMQMHHRSGGEKLILKGETTKRPSEWKLCLSNNDNKIQFIKLLLRVWSSDHYVKMLHGGQVSFICDDMGYIV